MARNRSMTSAMIRIQREAARAQAAQMKAQAQAQTAYARSQAAQLRAEAAHDRERQRLYVQARVDEILAMNDELTEQVSSLGSLLQQGLAKQPAFNFARLKQPAERPEPNYLRLQSPEPAPEPQAFTPPPPTGLAKMFRKAKYEQAVADSRTAFERAVAEHAAREQTRNAQFLQAKMGYSAAVANAQAAATRQHAEVDALETAYRNGEPEAVVAYYELVLGSTPYPDGFAQSFKIAYVPGSRQLVVEYELPTVQVVPAARAFRYVKATDSVSETVRPAAQVKSLYASVVAQTALRTLWEVLTADTAGLVDVVVFNGMVDTVNPGNGRRIHPCLVTVRTTRDTFAQLDLTNVEPLACLKHLSAGVSKSPAELVPVRPVLEFSMLDPRFVAESDAMSLLDERPNLLELNPTEFEVLIQNLFTRMGLEARQTRASRDGGVDCIAYDARPIFGGKVVIQSKRYKNTVGVSAVRDLYGTLQNEGASKGIL